MKKLALSGKLGKGLYALVDDEPYEILKWFTWNLSSHGYAICTSGKDSYMHRVLTKCPPGMQVDHINGNKLDNRRENLRTVSCSSNGQNKPWRRGSSGFKGVWGAITPHTWNATISIGNTQRKHLGGFKNKETAALMYDFWATYIHGSAATTNFPVIAAGPGPSEGLLNLPKQ